MDMPLPDDMFFDATLRRRSGGAYDSNGRWVDGTDTDSTIKASIQPITPEALRRLPETVRAHAEYLMVTPEQLRTTSQNGGVEQDQIVYLGETFGVVMVGYWPFADLVHGEYALVRKNTA